MPCSGRLPQSNSEPGLGCRIIYHSSFEILLPDLQSGASEKGIKMAGQCKKPFRAAQWKSMKHTPITSLTRLFPPTEYSAIPAALWLSLFKLFSSMAALVALSFVLIPARLPAQEIDRERLRKQALQAAEQGFSGWQKAHAHTGHPGQYCSNGQHLFQIMPLKEPVRLAISRESIQPTRDALILATIEILPENVQIRGKAYRRSGGFPFLFPWSKTIDYGKVFPPMKLMLLRNGELRGDGFFEGTTPVHTRQIDQLYDQDKKNLGRGGKIALAAFEAEIKQCFHAKGNSFFRTVVGGGPDRIGVSKIKTPDDVLNWQSMYALDETITMTEFVGGHQIRVDEKALNSVDQLNGVIGRGKISIAYRGYHRSATWSVRTRYQHPEDLTLRVREGWGRWNLPALQRHTWQYEILSKAPERQLSDAEQFLNGPPIPQDRSASQKAGPHITWKALDAPGDVYAWNPSSTDMMGRKQEPFGFAPPSFEPLTPVDLFGTSAANFARLMKIMPYEPPRLPEEAPTELHRAVLKR